MVCAAIYVAAVLAHPYVDGDLYWQRWLGERIINERAIPDRLGPEAFAAAGAPWTPQEWLFSVLVAASAMGGVPCIAWLASAFAAIAVLAFVVRALDRVGVSEISKALATFLVAIGILPSFGVRVQVFGWACFAALLWALDGERHRFRNASIVTLIWANVHASVAIAPVIALADAVATFAASRRFSRDVAERCALVPVLALLTCATPLGIRLPRYALMLVGSPIRSQISEWHRLNAGDFGFYIVVVAVLLSMLARSALLTYPRSIARTVLLVAASFMAARNAALVPVAAAPLVASGIARIERRIRRSPADESAPKMLGALATVTAIVVGVCTWYSMRSQTLWYPPATAISQLAAMPGRHRLFCQDFAWCSVALQYPNVGVFLDGRADPFPIDVWDDFAALRFHADRRVIRRRNIDAVLASPNGKLDAMLNRSRAWRRFYSDPHFRGYVLEDSRRRSIAMPGFRSGLHPRSHRSPAIAGRA